MINGLGVLGYGVGGIEAEAVLLGQPLYQPMPHIVGVRLHGELPRGSTATDLVLVVTEMLRAYGVVGAFVEFSGDGLASLALADRATISNMSPGVRGHRDDVPDRRRNPRLPPDDGPPGRTSSTSWSATPRPRVCGASRARRPSSTRCWSSTSAAWCRRSRVRAGPRTAWPLTGLKANFRTNFPDGLADVPEDQVQEEQVQEEQFESEGGVTDVRSLPVDQALAVIEREKPNADPATAAPEGAAAVQPTPPPRAQEYTAVPIELEGRRVEIRQGSVAIAAITSCTNTSNPTVMVGAGLLARNAVARGLTVPPTVKTSLAPGSRAVTTYLASAGLMAPLEALGFALAGYGCTTCIGNSGPLDEPIAKAIEENDLVVAAVLSGNRNFEGRIHPAGPGELPRLAATRGRLRAGRPGRHRSDPRAARPRPGRSAGVPRRPVADRGGDPHGHRHLDRPGALPLDLRHGLCGRRSLDGACRSPPATATPGTKRRRTSPGRRSSRAVGRPRRPSGTSKAPASSALLGDSVTTDHISPAGSISPTSPAGQWLQAHGVGPLEFNSYGARRGHHEVMMRGTFANIRLRNRLVPEREGPYTVHLPDGDQAFIYDAAMRYRAEGVPSIVIAGREYGSGSSRDWAAKGPMLLGVRAVIAESFERIHRSNLVGMGVLPLQFLPGESAASLGLSGREAYTITGLSEGLRPRQRVIVSVADDATGAERRFEVTARLDGPIEVDYYRNGGILPAVLRRLAREDAAAPS